MDPSGNDFSGCATLGSTVDTCYSSVHPAFGRILHHFCVDVDLDPEVFFSVLTQNGEVCSVDASGYGPCMRCPHLVILSFYELHMDGSWYDDWSGVGVSAQALAHVN